MLIKCIVTCYDATGTPAFFHCIVKCKQNQYDYGEHYDAAADAAHLYGYDNTKLVYEENDNPKDGFFELFDWDTAPIVLA
jgi:hypothetical protein